MSLNHTPRGEPPRSRTEPSAPARPFQQRPAPLAPPDHIELAALRRLEAKLRQAGATLPAPSATGTVEGAITGGLCIALCLVDAEIQVLARDAALASIMATMSPEQLQDWIEHRACVRQQIDRAQHHADQRQATAIVARAPALQSAEVAQLLSDLQRVGATATGEMIGICSQAGAVIQALLVGRDDVLEEAEQACREKARVLAIMGHLKKMEGAQSCAETISALKTGGAASADGSAR